MTKIQPGSRLGPYDIVALLGAGGMGEVWKARDARIGRDVALKVLPAHFANDPDRLARFQQEARAAGSLNHPNLVTLYDAGTESGVPYLAMELLEGESLRDKLDETHALPYRKALDYARQLATGLAAAHDKGIIHRDLKPENVFVTNDGRVKILDFGLAKLTGPAGEITADSVTQRQVTDPGAVMGTVGYMAPEQVRGIAADHRCDIFSLGAMLYEFFSGRRAFRRESSVETMNAILKEDPPELSTPDHPVSPAIERIIRRCLEKSRDERFQSARDLAFAIDALTDTTSISTNRPIISMKSRSRATAIAAALLALLALAYVIGRVSKKDAAQPHLRQLTFRNGTVRSARFTPDAQTVVYGAAWEGAPLKLFQYRLDSGAAMPLEYPDGDVLSISSKGELALSLGRKFVYWMNSGTLAKGPLLGNAFRKVADDVSWAEWNPMGDSFAVVRRVNGEDRLEYPLDTVLYRTTGYIAYPRFSNDGERIAFLDHPVFGDNRGDVAVITVRDRKKQTFVQGWSSLEGLAWSPKGEIWFSGAKVNGNFAIYATNGAGEPRCVWATPGNLIVLDLDVHGRALVSSSLMNGAMRAFARGATGEATLSNQGFSLLNAISNDGKNAVAVSYSGDASLYGDALLLPLNGGAATKLGAGLPLQFSPDGKWAIDLIASAPPKLMLYGTDAEVTKTIDTGSLNVANAAFLGDEHRVVATVPEGQAAKTVMIEVATGKKTLLPIASTGGNPVIERLLVSPDGSKIAIRLLPHNEPPVTHVYAINGDLLRKIPAEFMAINWTSDSRALYVYVPEQLPLRVQKLDIASGALTPWKQITPSDLSGAMSPPVVQMNPDGDAYAYSLLKMQTDLYVVDGLR